MSIPIIGQSKVEKTRLSCPRCQLEVEANVPKFELVNSEQVSMIVWSRGPEKVICVCGQEFGGAIIGAVPEAIQAAYFPLPPKSESDIIHPPSLLQH